MTKLFQKSDPTKKQVFVFRSVVHHLPVIFYFLIMVLAHDILTSERTQDIKITEDVSFESMLLSPNTLKGLKTSGFYVPSPIQLHGIPLGKCGFDLLLEAKSGTGKTAVFSVIALEKLNLNKGVQTLVLAPTREIASQICDVIKTIGANHKGLTVEVVMGGLSFTEDVEKFKKKVHIVVGSPGRLHHLIKNKHIDVSSVRLMVLDEADKLVEKSFLPDINYIFSLLPSEKQIIMSSATYPDGIKSIMSKYVQNAHHICPDSSSVLLGIEQHVTVVPNHVNIVKQTKNRYDELNQILSKKKFKQCLVFCNYQVRVGEVHKMLNKDKWPTDKLHGQQQQTDRLEALKILQEYQCRVLVTTDLAARGIDASNVDLVINFEIPYDWQTYLHRIGRAGRFGSYGSAITILCLGDEEKFKKLLGSIKIPFNLKYLWSEEPFSLDIIKSGLEICDEKINMLEKSETGTKKPGNKLGIKDSYEELWKVLSVDLTEPKKELQDIPTFESLCKSFEHVKSDSNVDSIESFSDLLSSFQNHEIKSKEKYNYSSVEVNQLLIPCNIFNSNIILQSIKKSELPLKIPLATDNNNKIHDNLMNTCNKKINHDMKLNENVDNTSGDAESEKTDNSCELVKEEDYIHIGKKHTRKDFPIASSSSEYTIQKTKGKAGKYGNISNRDFSSNKVELLDTWKIVSSETNTNNDQNYQEDSDSILHKSDLNEDVISQDYMYNDDEKLLRAANLPTAFGKCEVRNNLKSDKYKDVAKKKHFCSNYKSKSSSECKNPRTKSSMQPITKNKQAESPNETSGDETMEDESDSHSYGSLIGSKSSKDQNSHAKSKQPVSNNERNNHRNMNNISKSASRVIEERQHGFNEWYKQLKTQMLMIEKSVYIAEMSSYQYHQ